MLASRGKNQQRLLDNNEMMDGCLSFRNPRATYTFMKLISWWKISNENEKIAN
jgi:hypothetical protein